MKKLAQTLIILVAATFTFATVAAWGQELQFKKQKSTSKIVTLRVAVTENFEFEEYGSNDVKLNFIIGEVKSYKGLSDMQATDLDNFTQNGFHLVHQKNLISCADGLLILDISTNFDNGPFAEDSKMIGENAKVLSFVCHKKMDVEGVY